MKNKNSLVETAKASGVVNRSGNNVRHQFGDEQLEELAIAWLKNEVGISQAARALGKKQAVNVYPALASSIKRAFQNGNLKKALAK